MSKVKLGIISGIILIAGGVALLAYLLWSGAIDMGSIVQPPANMAVAQVSSTPKVNEIEGDPVELIIPSMNYDLKIIPGYYNTRTRSWNLTLSEVQYATITPEPNNVEGDTFMYGHYRYEVFASLHRIQIGAQAIVKTSNNHTFYYQLASEKLTNPGDDSVFTYRGKPILTIQTCAGIVYQYRQFFIFNFVKVV